MTALLFALALATAPQPGPPLDNAFARPPTVQRGPSPACAAMASQAVAPDGTPFFRKLNELPKGVLEHAVWRTVNGCPVREIRYQGRTYYVASSPAQAEKLEPAVKDAKPADR